MDPLSVTASVLTLLSALSVSVKTVKRVRVKSEDLQELSLDLERLKAITADLAKLQRLCQPSIADSGTLRSLQLTCAKLEHAQRFFEEKLSVKSSPSNFELLLKKRAWPNRRRDAKRLMKEIIDIKTSLQLETNVLNLMLVTTLQTNCLMEAPGKHDPHVDLTAVCEPQPGESHADGTTQLSIVLPISNNSLGLGELDAEEVVSVLDEFLNAADQLSETMSEVLYFYTPLTGSADWTFERSETYFPEAYVMQRPSLRQLSIVYSMTEVYRTAEYHVDKYFLLFPLDARHWKRLLITAMIHSSLRLAGACAVDNESRLHLLPAPVQQILDTEGPGIEFSDAVTSVFIELSGRQQSSASSADARCRVVERISNAPIANTLNRVRELEDHGVPQYLESEVILLAREGSLCVVLVESRVYIERRLPFTERSCFSDEPIELFFGDLEKARLAQECSAVARFGGVVLSDDRDHLLSYLLEAPEQGSLNYKLAGALRKGITIPWHRREKWIRQLLVATSELHEQGIVIGYCAWISSFMWLDFNDDLKLVRFSSRATSTPDRHGYMPPEHRQYITSNGVQTNPDPVLTIETDLFQLGLFVWRIANAVANSGRFLYHDSGCQTQLRYRCKEAHANPIQLPPCVDDATPTWVDVIVEHCRQEQPSDRMPATKLLSLIPTETQYDHASVAPDIEKVSWNLDRAPWNVFCDNCGKFTTESYYRCHTCHQGGLDFCPGCIKAGVFCWDQDHTLDLVELRGEGFVRGSANATTPLHV